MARHGLARGEDGLEVYVMCEIPNNVILIDEFAELFDGFSIGSNDLTQLTLGVDRDSRDGRLRLRRARSRRAEILKLAVEGAQRNGRHSGICGQAPSDYPEIAEYLVRAWHRLDQPQPRQRAQDHARGGRAGEEARPRSPTANAGSNRLRLPGASGRALQREPRTAGAGRDAGGSPPALLTTSTAGTPCAATDRILFT